MLAKRKMSRPNVIRHPFLRIGIQKSVISASETPVATCPSVIRLRICKAEGLAGVVAMVMVAITAFGPVTLAGLVDPKLKVGGSMAPPGAEVIEADSFTDPVNPPAGVTVMTEVLPVVAPAVSEAVVPLILKLGGGRLIV